MLLNTHSLFVTVVSELAFKLQTKGAKGFVFIPTVSRAHDAKGATGGGGYSPVQVIACSVHSQDRAVGIGKRPVH